MFNFLYCNIFFEPEMQLSDLKYDILLVVVIYLLLFYVTACIFFCGILIFFVGPEMQLSDLKYKILVAVVY